MECGGGRPRNTAVLFVCVEFQSSRKRSPLLSVDSCSRAVVCDNLDPIGSSPLGMHWCAHDGELPGSSQSFFEQGVYMHKELSSFYVYRVRAANWRRKGQCALRICARAYCVSNDQHIIASNACIVSSIELARWLRSAASSCCAFVLRSNRSRDRHAPARSAQRPYSTPVLKTFVLNLTGPVLFAEAEKQFCFVNVHSFSWKLAVDAYTEQSLEDSCTLTWLNMLQCASRTQHCSGASGLLQGVPVTSWRRLISQPLFLLA